MAANKPSDKTEQPQQPETPPTPDAQPQQQQPDPAAAVAAASLGGVAPSGSALAAAAADVAVDMMADLRRPTPGLVYDRSKRRGVPHRPGMPAPAGPRFVVHHPDPDRAPAEKAGVQLAGGVGETDDADIARMFKAIGYRVVDTGSGK